MGRNPYGFLHEVLCFRFFYRRKPSLPYACTATRRFSTILHLFYLSPSPRETKTAQTYYKVLWDTKSTKKLDCT